MEERDDPQQQQQSPALQQVAQTLAEAEEMLKSLETVRKDLDISAGGEAVARPIRQAERSLRYSVQLSLSRTRQNTDTDNYGFPIESEEQRKYQPIYGKQMEEQKKVWKAYLIKNKFRIDKSSMQLKTMVRKGIHPNTRKEAWLACSGAKKNMQLHPGYYDRILWENRDTQSISEQQIDLDAPRTFPGHPYFNQEGQNKLKRVLMAYSWRNTAVGYCQSMNYLVGMLLLFMREEEAFWMLCAIMEEIQPADYYDKKLLGVQIDQKVFEDLVASKLPTVHQHLRKFDLPLSLVTTQWFSCIFVKDFPPEVALRIWDCIFLEGNKILFRVGLALLYLHAKEILGMTDYQSLYTLLKGMAQGMHDCDLLMKTTFGGIGSFPRKKIARLRNHYYPLVLEEQQQLDAQREKMLADIRARTLLFQLSQSSEHKQTTEAGET